MHYHNMCLQIMLEVRRLGGGFGSKIDRNHLVSVPCALAAHVMNAPVKIALDLNTNMKMIGKRYCYMNVCFNTRITFHDYIFCLFIFFCICYTVVQSCCENFLRYTPKILLVKLYLLKLRMLVCSKSWRLPNIHQLAVFLIGCHITSVTGPE